MIFVLIIAILPTIIGSIVYLINFSNKEKLTYLTMGATFGSLTVFSFLICFFDQHLSSLHMFMALIIIGATVNSTLLMVFTVIHGWLFTYKNT